MKLTSIAFLASVFAATLVHGQTSPQGGHQASASPQAQAVKQACQSEVQSLCPGKTGHAAISCLQSNASSEKMSSNCKNALQQLEQSKGRR
jgi:hypothetical protein